MIGRSLVGLTYAAIIGGALIAVPAAAEIKHRPIELIKCDEPIGNIAVVEGSNRGWVKDKLSSPKPIVKSLAKSSGCFTVFNINSGTDADFMLTVIAGDMMQVEEATRPTHERVGAAGNIAQAVGRQAGYGGGGGITSAIPLAGEVLKGIAGVFGGGPKSNIVTGMTLSDIAMGEILIAGTGEVRKTKLKFHDKGKKAMSSLPEGYWMKSLENLPASRRYTKEEEGREMVHSLVIAFNNLVSQAAAMRIGRQEPEPQVASNNANSQMTNAVYQLPGTTPIKTSPTAPAEEQYQTVKTVVDTALYLEPSRAAKQARKLRSATQLIVIGDLQGTFLPVTDAYGVLGWVSVEDLE